MNFKNIYAFVCALVFAISANATPLTSGKFLTTGGEFYREMEMGWDKDTKSMPSIEVTVNGTQVTIVGLAYWFEEGGITGTMDGNTITFASGQKVGEDLYGPEYLLGSNDKKTVCDIVFTYDPSAQTLTSTTKYIYESGMEEAISPYCYWEDAVFTKEGAEQAIDHTTAATKSVKRVVDGQLIIFRDGKAFNVLGAQVQ